MLDFVDLAGKRKSCRSFSEQKVEPDAIEKICHAGTLAPSAWGRKGLQFFILQDPRQIAQASRMICSLKESVQEGSDPIFYSAPAVVLIGLQEQNRHEFSEFDAGFAVQNCLLQATEMGLHTCVIGFANLLNKDLKMKAELGLQADWEVFLAFCVGHAR